MRSFFKLSFFQKDNLFIISSSVLLLFFIVSCADKKKDYDKSKAVSAFALVDSLAIDKSLEKTAITIPKQQQNNFWNGSIALQNQNIENFGKNFSTTKNLFSSKREITLKNSDLFFSGIGATDFDDFIFAPIIKDNKIFALNAAGKLTAYDLLTKKRIWKTQIFTHHFLKNYRSAKIYYNKNNSGEKIFATIAINKIAAINAVDGKILWIKDLSSITNSTPICDDELVFVTTNDNKIYALNALNGEIEWVVSAILRNTAILGAADPLLYKDKVIAAFSSGEIYAINKKTGELIWSQDLNLNKANSSDFYLNDIDATPLIKDDTLYSIGNGGLMMAISLKDGNYFWRKEIAGIVDFWAAANFLYLINNDNKLLAIDQKTGGIKWISQLPNLKKDKKPETKIIYNSVIMVGDKLLISRVDGELIIASPFDGKIEKTFNIGRKILHAPAVVNDKIYFHNMSRFVTEILEIE
ncbi:MAG: PQQ-binding-like beta-propeller repeat protein [Rickettsiales bacterium]|nr:PQQ-binding-like beta-propeller repeat protein [Rickettsiales bacterium]